jgi:hypothetical protein
MLLITSIFIFLIALIFALFEIEIEGKHGWAQNNPTWKKQIKIISYLTGNKPLTGYHLFMLIFIFLMFHIGFIFNAPWTLALELQIISYFIIFIILEDILWFIFNPYYGIKNYKKSKIWWHKDCNWVFGIFPIFYIYAIFSTTILIYISSILQNNPTILITFLQSLIIITFLVIISIIFSKPYTKLYHLLRK